MALDIVEQEQTSKVDQIKNEPTGPFPELVSMAVFIAYAIGGAGLIQRYKETQQRGRDALDLTIFPSPLNISIYSESCPENSLTCIFCIKECWVVVIFKGYNLNQINFSRDHQTITFMTDSQNHPDSLRCYPQVGIPIVEFKNMLSDVWNATSLIEVQ